ncbi:DEAD/DEAH box helicase family protein [Gaopeijia maritima]|uniref:DEAD/DEAH box helicase family protein n=1 Tax=Gaopeijia maritima TaxID=3119007 RepID=UPI003275F95C
MTSSGGSLRAMRWDVGYASDTHDMIADFYEPALSRAIRYDRAVGYFSSSALALIAGGIRTLYARGGKIRLVASPCLSPQDVSAINRGEVQRNAGIESALEQMLDPAQLRADEAFRLGLLSGMIATGLLEIRIAVKESTDGRLGLFHEKVGVIEDCHGDFVTFIGSPNETWSGWVGNAESFALHTSWGAGAEHARWERQHFESTWFNRRAGVLVLDFPDATKRRLMERFPPREADGRPLKLPDPSGGGVMIPSWLAGEGLRAYQRDAVNSWLEGRGRGIFAMATGTGKTITALTAAAQVYSAVRRDSPTGLLVLVIVPSRDLVRQWEQNAAEFGFLPVLCHGDASGMWPDRVRRLFGYLDGVNGSVGMIITTADTYTSGRFQALLATHGGTTMLVADEVHSLGTQRRLAALPEVAYRLGLSATPRRHGDERGTEELLRYFGKVVTHIDIREAIELGALVPYSYEPIIVGLTEAEHRKYQDLTSEIGQRLGGAADFDSMPESAKFLLLERSRLVGHATGKLSALRTLMSDRRDIGYQLIYVAEGAHPLSGVRQLDDVVRLLGSELEMRVATYTSETAPEDRQVLQSELRAGGLQALVAMRCLDEGIDIPEVRTGVILASTQNPRQFVQRRGRILRRDDAGGKVSAQLFDMIVLPERPRAGAAATFQTDRRLVARELSRALELASGSMNGDVTPPSSIVDALEAYDLLHLTDDYGDPTYWDSSKDNDVTYST